MLIKKIFKKILARYNLFDFLNLFLFVVCCVFSVYDISSHIKNYYEYKVIVNTKLDFHPKIYLPSITLCIPTVVNNEQFAITFPEIYEKVQSYIETHNQSLDDYEWRGVLANYLTIGQLKQLTPNFKQVFMSCMFRTNQDKLVDCDRYVPIQSHLSMNHNCYIFFEQKPSELSDRVDQFNFDPSIPFDYSKVNKSDKSAHWKRKREAQISDKEVRDEYFLYDQKMIKSKDWVRILINKTSLWNGWLDFGIAQDGRFFEMYHGQPNVVCKLSYSSFFVCLFTINFRSRFCL